MTKIIPINLCESLLDVTIWHDPDDQKYFEVNEIHYRGMEISGLIESINTSLSDKKNFDLNTIIQDCVYEKL